MFLPLLLSACSGAPADSAASDADTPTYYANVKPSFDRVCMRCHDGNGWAPSFADPAYVQALAPVIKQRIADGTMPPAAPDPSCRAYEGSEALTLTDAEKETIAAWADGGAALGNEADDASTPTTITTAPFDQELWAGAAYTPDFADDGNDYWCYGLDVGNEDAIYMSGLEAIVGNPRIVHHIVLFTVDDDHEIDTSAEGFSCGGLGEDGWEYLTGWAPGATPVQFPVGSAMRLPAHQRLALAMHYFGDADVSGETDLSGYGLHLTDQPDKGVIVYPMGVQNFTVPAGEAAKEVSMKLQWDDTYGTFHIMGVWPHMHLLGRAFSFTVGSRKDPDCLIDSSPWDFHNQVPVPFEDEVVVQGGDHLTLTCTFDNSAASPYQYNEPPQDIEYGENTTNEMCFGFTYGWFE